MTYPVIAIILFTVMLSACAQLALKLGVLDSRFSNAMEIGLADGLIAACTSPLILLGLLIYVVSVAMWLWVLSKVDLSVAYPFVGISFIVTMAFGMWLLDENVTPIRIIGTLFIASGCILVARSA